jgi:hypothetical protein
MNLMNLLFQLTIPVTIRKANLPTAPDALSSSPDFRTLDVPDA